MTVREGMHTDTLLRRLRQERGWTQRELARRVGCTPSFISQVESRTCQPTYTMLHRLARALEVSDDTLLAMFLPEEPPAPTTTRAVTSR